MTLTSDLPDGTTLEENLLLACPACGRSHELRTKDAPERVACDGRVFVRWPCTRRGCDGVVQWRLRVVVPVAESDADYR